MREWRPRFRTRARAVVTSITLCLLATALPALAQDADPLSLAVEGVLLPYVNTNGDFSVAELATPVGASGASLDFFDASCARIGGTGLTLTQNDVALVQTIPIGAGIKGLIAVRSSVVNPIHSRVYWFNTATGRARVLEPVTIQQYHGVATWNPLRTGATFFAPLEGGGLHTTLYLICPKTTIQGADGSAFPVGPYPAIVPPFLDDYPLGTLRGRVYDVDERLLADVVVDCDCLIEKGLDQISSVYSDPVSAPTGTYTELESSPVGGGGFAFTGYKAITAQGLVFDLFGRLSTASRNDLGGGVPTPANR